MSIWVQLVLVAVPTLSAAAGVWWAFQLWMAKRQGANEQALTDKLANSQAENAFLKEVNEIDANNRTLTSTALDDKLR